jgi:hypothetical protein
MKTMSRGTKMEAQTLQNATGAGTSDVTNLGALLVFAVQGTLILFFIVSPVMGYLLARSIQKRVNGVIAWCMGVMVILVGNFGVSVLLRRVIPQEQLSDLALTLLCGAGSFAAGILLARYIVFFLADPGKPQWVVEYENMPQEDMLPFERRKHMEVERRKRAKKM